MPPVSAQKRCFSAESDCSIGLVQTRSNDECLTQIRHKHFDVAPALHRAVHGLCRIKTTHAGSRSVYLSVFSPL
jgi:hypothetical protein